MRHAVSGHWIKQNHESAIPRHIMAIDTETRQTAEHEGTAHRFKLGWTARCVVKSSGSISSEVWKPWKDAVALLDYMEREAPLDSVLWLFANNVFFDLQAMGFFREFTRRDWRLDFIHDDQGCYMLIIRKGRRTIKALSVSNYWSASTRSLGDMLGRGKADPDFDTVDDATLSCYCFRDTEIVLDVMEQYFLFVRSANLGAFRLSRAAQAYGAWRHRFMQTKVLCHADEEVRALEGAAYLGGRVEAYRIGKVEGGPFSCYDVNSMYPFIMSRYKLPDRCVGYHDSLSVTDAADILIDFSAIAEVTIETDEPMYAYRLGEKLIFPVGRFRTFLCTEGLRQSLMRGHLKAVHRLAAYSDAILFREYVDYFYKLRVEAKARGDRVTDRMAKLLMNSLYGKMGQRRPVAKSDRYIRGVEYSRVESYVMSTHEYLTTTRLFHREIVTEGRETSPGAVLAIPAHITEYGRMLLYDIQEKIGRERVLYCDTDSVFIEDDPAHTIAYPVEPSTIGALSKKWTTTALTIHGAKDYEVDGVATLKGVPPSADLIGERTYRFTFWPGQRTHMQEGIDDRYITRDTVKVVNMPYDKGEVSSDGRVTPWRLPDHLAEIGQR